MDMTLWEPLSEKIRTSTNTKANAQKDQEKGWNELTWKWWIIQIISVTRCAARCHLFLKAVYLKMDNSNPKSDMKRPNHYPESIDRNGIHRTTIPKNDWLGKTPAKYFQSTTTHFQKVYYYTDYV